MTNCSAVCASTLVAVSSKKWAGMRKSITWAGFRWIQKWAAGGKAWNFCAYGRLRFQQLIFEFVQYFNATAHRAMYDDIVNKCVNMELMNKFELSGYSLIEYCIKGDVRLPLGEALWFMGRSRLTSRDFCFQIFWIFSSPRLFWCFSFWWHHRAFMTDFWEISHL